MEIGISSVFTKVFFLVGSIFTVLITWTILQNIDFELLAFHNFKVVHCLSSHFRLMVMLEFNNGMALIFTGVWILWEFNRIYTSEGTEPFSDVLLSQCRKLAS